MSRSLSPLSRGLAALVAPILLAASLAAPASAAPTSEPESTTSESTTSAPAIEEPGSLETTSFASSGATGDVPPNTVLGGLTPGALTPYPTHVVPQSQPSTPYRGQMTLSTSTIEERDYWLFGVTLTLTNMGANQRIIITDTDASGKVRTWDPLVADSTGRLTTTIVYTDACESGFPGSCGSNYPALGEHLIEATSSTGIQSGAVLDVTPSDRLSATTTVTPSTLTAQEFYDTHVTVEGEGFDPNEWVTLHVSLPGGESTSQVGDNTLQADDEGRIRFYLRAGSAGVTPGRWRATFIGMDSGRNAPEYFTVLPVPGATWEGTVELAQDEITRSEIASPGLTWSAVDLPPFGLYDATLRDAVGRYHGLGRFRANGEGQVTSVITGTNAPAGPYTLELTNVNTANFLRGTFVVTLDDGTVPEQPTVTVEPDEADALTVVSEGVRISATGFQPGQIVSVVIRDFMQERLPLRSTDIWRKQADENGDISFQVRADVAPAPGEWTVTVRSADSSLTLTTPLIVLGDVPADPGESPDPSPTDPGIDPQPPAQIGNPAPLLPGVDQPRAWFVRTSGEGALALSEPGELTAQSVGVSSAAADRASDIESTVEAVADELVALDEDAEVLYESVWTVPGVAVHTDQISVEELLQRDDVVSITPISLRDLVEPVSTIDTPGVEPANAPSDELTRTLEAWTTGGQYTGDGVTIAVIDTGVDYTHAAFNGTGTTAAYQAARSGYPAVMPPAEGFYDPEVILPGWDFAGTQYNGRTFTVPRPDANPLDVQGHGTHVAATAAGRGVTQDGAAFDGDYTELTVDALNEMWIGPGSAPQAQIVPLKIFGDNGGSTALTGAALDWVGGQIAAGEQIDVINLSVGLDYGVVDDPENEMVNMLIDYGVVPVISAGNAGDFTGSGGSPGNAAGSLAVAASASGAALLDGVDVLAPEEITGTVASQYATNEPFIWNWSVSAPVVAPAQESNLDGCATFSDSDRELVGGNIVWLEWDDADVACGSAVRFANAYDAGAVGVLLPSDLSQFETGIAGDWRIPGAQLNRDATQALRPAMESGTLEVRLAQENKQISEVRDPALQDTVASFTARGAHGSVDQVIKPDLSAPGVNVVSARVGSGQNRISMSGTSMAAPHTAGIAALTRQARPEWSAQQIKTVLMNTATHEVTGPGGYAVSPLRQGTGRVDAVQATTADVLVSSVENGQLVSASFGVVEVSEDGYSEDRTLRLTNVGSNPQTYDLGYQPRTVTPGAEIEVLAEQVVVPAGGTAEVTVRLSIPEAEALRRSIDPGFEDTQDTSRHVTDLSGVVTFSPVDADVPPLWITVFAAPKPVSQVQGEPVSFDHDAGQSALSFSGTLLDQGEGAQAYQSRVTPLVLGGTSPALDLDGSISEASLRGVDVLTYGAVSTAPTAERPSQGTFAAGVELAGPVIGLGSIAYPMVYLDLDGDQRTDFIMMPSLNRNTGQAEVITYDAGTQGIHDVQPINNLTGSTNQWDNDTVVYTVGLDTLGYTDSTTQTNLNYRVVTQSLVAPLSEEGTPIVDETDPVEFDVYAPPVWFDTGAGSHVDLRADTQIEVHRDLDSQLEGVEILTIAHDNGTGTRAPIAPITVQDAPEPPALVIDRIEGANRYDTAAQISAAHYEPGAEVVYIATGLDFADALAGSALAGHHEAPLLLTRDNWLPRATAAELTRLAPERVVIFGGSSAVNSSVAEAIAAAAGVDEVERLEGEDRYQTSAAIAAQFDTADTVFVATGRDFPDALSGAAVAGTEAAPLVLSNTGSISRQVLDQIERLDPDTIVIVGDDTVVSDAVAQRLAQYATVERAHGPTQDRYGTNAALLQRYDAAEQVYLATGQGWPDAVVGAALAGAQGHPLALTRSDHLPNVIRAELERLGPARVVIFGSESVVDGTVVDQLRDLDLP